MKFSVALVGLVALFLTATDSNASGVPLSYTGRLTNADGSPVSGPVNLKLDLAYTDAIGDIVCTKTLNSVPLTNGVFHLKITTHRPTAEQSRSPKFSQTHRLPRRLLFG